MWSQTPAFFVLVLLLGIWIAVARETRVAVHGYLFQTSVVALLYFFGALETKDLMVWVDLFGLVILRIGVIPWLLYRLLQGDLYTARRTEEVLASSYSLALYAVLAAIGLGVGKNLQSGTMGIDFGIALSVLLIGLATVAIAHHAPKQVIGILSVDNGIDLAVVLTLTRFTVVTEYAVFVDVALAVLCLSLMVLRLSTYGQPHTHHFNELRG